uniref:Collagen type IV alpha-3-binding protein n=1 Tax=Syphacia muris TaxID=451379 RepID=A0A158R4K8_9BILA
MNINNNDFLLTNDNEHGDSDKEVVLISGILWKWTNFLMGWQERYFELQNGILMYYKSESEKQFGIRGSITLRCATIQGNDDDETHFEISANGVSWHLKAESLKSKAVWLQAVNSFVSRPQNGNMECLEPTNNISTYTARRSVINELKDKVSELEKSRQLARLQIERLQQRLSLVLPKAGVYADGMSLKEEGLALELTAASIVRDVNVCIQLLNEEINLASSSCTNIRLARRSCSESVSDVNGDVEEFHDDLSSPTVVGSTGMLSDSEWHDALESESDESVRKQDVKLMHNDNYHASDKRQEAGDNTDVVDKFIPLKILSLPLSHPLSEEINRITLEQLHYAKAGVEDNSSLLSFFANFLIAEDLLNFKVWELFSEEGEMRMYKMEMEVEGLICDPFKATHCVQGVTAREYIHFFYEPKYKGEWDETIDRMNVVEILSPDTCVIHQIHKKVWPAARRESLFWSHVRKIDSGKDSDAHDLFMVCNHDTQRSDVPLENPSNVRVGVTVAMVCQTIITKPGELANMTRNDVKCRIIYVAQVNPGGWVPAGALRVIYKREYPKFLRGFTKYVVERVHDKPLRF